MATADRPTLDDDESLIDGVARPSGPMTEEEFLAWITEDVKAEWVDGEVIIMCPSSSRHVVIVGWLTTIMTMYCVAHGLGKVLGPELMIRLPGGRRRVPDVLFIAQGRLGIIGENHVEGGPDLTVEVISPDSEARDRVDKMADYAAAGVREYWIIDPDGETLEIHDLGGDGRFHPRAIEGGRATSGVIPGFSVEVDWLGESPMPNEWETLRSLGLPG